MGLFEKKTAVEVAPEGEQGAAPLVLGPIDKRKCRDVLFLVIFIAFWIGMFIVANTSFTYGDPKRLLMPRDSSGNYCGAPAINNTTPGLDLTHRPYLYYFNPLDPISFPSVCVTECPKLTSTITPSSAICQYGFVPTLSNLPETLVGFKCAPLIIASKPVMNRCIPLDPIPADIATSALQAVNADAAVGAAKSVLTQVSDLGLSVTNDLTKSWPYLVGAVFVALIVSFTWLFLLRIFAKPMVWTMIIGVDLLLAALAGFCYYYWQDRYNYFMYGAEPGHNSEQVRWEYIAAQSGFIVFTILFVIMVIITIALRKKIMLACEIVKEASKAVGTMPFVIFFPVFIWTGSVLLFVYFIYVLLYILSIDRPFGVASFGITMSDPNLARYMLVYHVFGFFWGFAFLQGINQLTIAGSFATYYWTLDKRAIRLAPVTQAFWRTIRYHLGSICLGSLLLSVVQILKLIVNLIRRKLSSNSQNKALIFILGCISCCLRGIEGIVKWINKNAYIKIAIDGQAFCKACTSAFWLISRNALKMVAVDFVTDVLLFMSKLNITTLTALIAYAVLDWKSEEMGLKFIFVPVAIIAMEAYVVASAFLSVYHMGIDTLFMSFMEDLDKNDGSPEKPYYMSDELKNLLQVRNGDQEITIKAKIVSSDPSQPKSKRVVPVDEF
ncbi:hypothetical protein HDV05_000019 [Chytridiales sp. JEL 0842]|nr:hypothetical protein HDV05_000019 [Chytridiales sp. JEL 0842]